MDPERPGLRRMRDDAKEACRAFDIVLVESPIRLSRNMVEVMAIKRELAKLGIQLYCADEGCTVSAALFSDHDGEGY
jgi:DNA invertase Pin-like site-specific DNA recombinase